MALKRAPICDRNVFLTFYVFFLYLPLIIFNVKIKTHECHDVNVFLKADKALSKLNFLFHLNLKRNSVNLRKWVIYIIFNIIKLVHKFRSAKRDDQIACPRRVQTCEPRAMRMCPRSGQIFVYYDTEEHSVKTELRIRLLRYSGA